MHTHPLTLTQKAAIKALKKGTLPDSKLYHRRDIRLSKIRIQNTQPNVFVIFINFLKSTKMSLTKSFFVFTQRLAGATLLVFANKQDLPGALSAEEIRDVSISNL